MNMKGSAAQEPNAHAGKGEAWVRGAIAKRFTTSVTARSCPPKTGRLLQMSPSSGLAQTSDHARGFIAGKVRVVLDENLR